VLGKYFVVQNMSACCSQSAYNIKTIFCIAWKTCVHWMDCACLFDKINCVVTITKEFTYN